MTILCSIIAALCCRQKVNKVAAVSSNQERAGKRKSNEKTLVLLTIWQSIFVSVDTFMFIVFNTLSYTKPDFSTCGANIMAPVVQLTMELAEMLQFFVLFVISKQFRSIILGCVRMKCHKVLSKQNPHIV